MEKKLKRFDAVLFDLDGTLMQSAPGIFDSFRYAASQFGVSLDGVDLRPFLGPPLRENFGRFLPADQVERAIAVYRSHYEDAAPALTCPYPLAFPLLARLRQEGISLAVATCKLREAALMILDAKEMTGCLDYVGGASADGTVETKEEVIRSVMAQPAFAGKRLLMVGDRIDDIRGARACRLPVAAVTYGYGSLEELKGGKPDFLVQDGDELLNCILGKKAQL